MVPLVRLFFCQLVSPLHHLHFVAQCSVGFNSLWSGSERWSLFLWQLKFKLAALGEATWEWQRTLAQFEIVVTTYYESFQVCRAVIILHIRMRGMEIVLLRTDKVFCSGIRVDGFFFSLWVSSFHSLSFRTQKFIASLACGCSWFAFIAASIHP